MHNATFLAQQNELLRTANANQTSKHTKSTKRVAFKSGLLLRRRQRKYQRQIKRLNPRQTQGDEAPVCSQLDTRHGGVPIALK